jgi:sarcosine oxidase subunit gamma
MVNFQTTARTPLIDKTSNGLLNMQELAPQTMINLRGNMADETFQTATLPVLQCALPTAPNTTVQVGDIHVLWLGPNEWLIRAPETKRDSLITSLKGALEGVTAAMVDVSDYYTVIRISGVHAHDALAVGCPLDKRTMTTGSCAQSHYAQAAILLYQTDDTPTFELQVRWSYAEYLWEYLETVAISK